MPKASLASIQILFLLGHVRQRVAAGDDVASRIDRRQAVERHRHPVGVLDRRGVDVQRRRDVADDGAGALGVLLTGNVHLDTELAAAFLEPGDRVGRRGIVPIEGRGGGANFRKGAERRQQKHGCG
ncbi:MAG TPA: hypothetical protein VG735_11455 [Caulobacterales bacterium]|nr:hypothetical protein [Caulobacterales bacterium]